MKILHIETGMHRYGGAQQVLYLLEQLRDAPMTNVLLCCPGSAVGEAAKRLGVPVRHLDAPGATGLALLRSLNRTLKAEQPNLVHVHSRRLGMDLFGGLAARRRGIPAIVSRRVDNPEPRWLARLKYRPYARVIAISEGIRQVMLGEGMDPSKVVTVRSAVDVGACRQPCDPARFRETFGLTGEGPVIAVIAQLIERKGHRHLIAALPEIEQRWPGLQTLFFGQGALRDALAQSIRDNNLRSVKLAGFRDDLARWLGCFDVVVHPADREGLGVALLQASAAGAPIIATRAGGMPEIVRDGENGLLIEPGDVAALRESLIRLLDDKALRQRMGQRGREITETEFSTAVMAEGNLAIYRQVLSEANG